MANYKQVTLSDPAGTLPDLLLKGFGADGYTRSVANRVVTTGRTQINVPKLGGRPGTYSYFLWTLSAGVTTDEANLFEGYQELCDSRFGQLTDGHILLIDEYLPVRSRPDRTLVDGANFTQYGQTYGYGIFKVLLTLPNGHRTYTAGHIEQIQFDAEELPAIL